MSAHKHKLTIGTELYWDGATHVVVGFVGAAVELRSNKGKISRVSLASLAETRDFRIITSGPTSQAGETTTFPDNVPEAEIKKAQRLLAHLLEARTGYRGGNAALAQGDEPRPQFNPEFTNLNQRITAKATELGLKPRWIYQLLKRYEQQGISGLIDHRTIKLGGDHIDEWVKRAAEAVLDEITDLSNISKNQIARRTARKLKEDHPELNLVLPPQTTFNRLLQRLTKGRGTFGSAKARRSIADRPRAPYSHFRTHRPGEAVLIDGTPLDAYAMDPYTFQWVQVQLTIAYDLYSRSILAWRFTPVSTKAVDAALLLYDIVRPKLMQPAWPATGRWPYVGVPENIVLELAGDSVSSQPLVGIPFVHPDSVLIDRGRVFLSQAFTDACARLGVNVLIARPLTPTDKAHIERLFRSIRELFVEHLPAYKGPDVFSRGAAVEDEAFYFIDEIDALFGEWVATFWQRRHHDGLDLPCVPALKLSPNDMYEEGIARAGFVYLVPDDRLYYELLPTEWRTIQHYGVEVRGLRYDGDILEDFRNETSPYSGNNAGKWPLRYDPRDQSSIFFYDHTLDQWHTLNWIGQSDVSRPFNEATLSYAKSLVLSRGGNPRNHDELRAELNGLLNRIEDRTLTGSKERRLAAINATHAQLVDRDRPRTRSPEPPDGTSTILPDGPLIHVSQPTQTDSTSAQKAHVITVFRTVDEAMEDDDDDLAL